MSIPAQPYIEPVSDGGTGDMSGTSEIRFGIITTLHVGRVSIHLSAPDDSGTGRAQTFGLWGTDDPRAAEDKRAGTTTADWVRLTLPAGSVHIDSVASAFSITLPSATLALADDIAKCLINVENPPAFLELRMDAGGTASSGTATDDDDLSAWISGY